MMRKRSTTYSPQLKIVKLRKESELIAVERLIRRLNEDLAEAQILRYKASELLASPPLHLRKALGAVAYSTHIEKLDNDIVEIQLRLNKCYVTRKILTTYLAHLEEILNETN